MDGVSEEVGPRHRAPEESTSPGGGAPWRRGPRVAGRSSRAERRRVAAAAERSRLVGEAIATALVPLLQRIASLQPVGAGV